MATLKDLTVYRKSFELAMQIFEITKIFPAEEKFSLVSQIRRSSRAVCANLAEGYRKRQYPAHFVAKISDADMENTETRVWLDFSLSCGYINNATFETYIASTIEVGKSLNHMMNNPEKYQVKIESKL